ncbi:MAG: efflux RND transporter periplasmic adaptor subunit [Novosphingobium sp.]
MERKTIIGGAALAAVVLGGLGWWAAQGGSDAPPAQEGAAEAGAEAGGGQLTPEQISRMGITTAVASESDATQLGVVPAVVTLPPESRVAVTAPFGGTVTRLFVVNGQAVTKGQALAVVRSIEPVQYGAAMARGEAQLAVARANAERASQLAREGIIAGARADEARAALREAEVAVSENRRILAQSGASAGGEVTLRAPITGKIAAVAVQTGGPVDGLTAPFVIENTASFMLDLQIPERLAGQVRPGMAIALADGGSEAAEGQIISVGNSIDQETRALVARARIGSSPLLVSGKGVSVILKGKSAVRAVSVPAAAVSQMGGKDVVFVAVPKGFARREVVVAGRGSETVTLASGLKAGERVATSGLAELKVLLGGE